MKFWHRGEEWLLCFLLALLTALVFLEALMRQWNTGALWLGEAIEWAAAWFVLFGMAYGVRSGAHIGLSILTDRVRHPALKRLLALLALGVCLLYSGILLGSSWVYVRQSQLLGFELTDLYLPAEALGAGWPEEDVLIKRWLLYSGLILGFGLLLLRFLKLFYAVARGRLPGMKFADEAQEAVAQFHSQEPQP